MEEELYQGCSLIQCRLNTEHCHIINNINLYNIVILLPILTALAPEQAKPRQMSSHEGALLPSLHGAKLFLVAAPRAPKVGPPVQCSPKWPVNGKRW